MGQISKNTKTSAGRLFGINRIYGAEDGKTLPYMTRAWFGRLRFHIFHRGDQDPDCHDHPWGFWTFPLRSYVEEVLEERVETRWGHNDKLNAPFKHERRYFERRTEIVRAFKWHYRPATYRHRVLGAWDGAWAIDHEPSTESGRDWALDGPTVAIGRAVPTIVWREKASRPWGFTKERNGKWCWVGWTDYVFNGGKAAPCQDEKP